MGWQNIGAHKGHWLRGLAVVLMVAGLLISSMGGGGDARAKQHPALTFNLVRSATAETTGCLTKAKGTVKIFKLGFAEKMQVAVSGLPKNTEFDVFVTQLPNTPFGISWYQGDLESNDQGNAHGKFVGRFSIETFAVAPGPGPAPVVHDSGTIKDAATNPAFAPVHTYHVGVWFNSGQDAANAGCANVITPFNGDHTAGPQALSTRQFADTAGPLRQLVP